MTLTDFGTLIIALGTIGSLLYIARQSNLARQQAKGQFVLELDKQFAKAGTIMIRLINEDGFTPVGEAWMDVWRFMSVFERMNIMIEANILDVGLVDRLYGFGLVNLIANDAIYERLKATGAEWQDFIDLCYKIADYRGKKPDIYGDISALTQRIYKLNKTTRRIDNPFRYASEG